MNIIITGRKGYIAGSLKKYLNHNVTLLDTRKNFTADKCDVLIHCAGIVHRKGVSFEEYKKINLELTKQVSKIKTKHFIFFSTMSVYGLDKGIISKDTPENPSNFYGETKLLAEKYLSENIQKLTILRPPMVYGKNCSGNFAKLKNLALQFPVFPKVQNSRSMIYIDNLCEFVKLVIENKKFGILFPQNREYVNTSDMYSKIRQSAAKKTLLVPLPMPKIGVLKKIFGDLCYDFSLSDTFNFAENKTNFKESIKKSL